MKFVVIGVKKSEGVYNDKPYSNYVFYFGDKEDKNVLSGIVPYSRGSKVITYKCKVSEWDKNINPKDFYTKEVSLTFDVYGNVASMDLLG